MYQSVRVPCMIMEGIIYANSPPQSNCRAKGTKHRIWTCSSNNTRPTKLENNPILSASMEVRSYSRDDHDHSVFNFSLAGNLNNIVEIGEATMDIELMMGLLGSNITLQLYQIGDESEIQRESNYSHRCFACCEC